MVKLRSIGGAKVWQQDWTELQRFSDQEQCFSLSERDINLLLSFVAYQAQWSTRWGGYEDFAVIREYLAGLVYRLLEPSDNCKGTNGGDGSGGTGGGGRLDFYTGDNDDMAGIGIIRLGGKAYLAQDCGCSDTALFELTPVSVSGGGGLVAAGNGGGTDVPNGGFSFPPAPVDCYASKAVDYLFRRASEYAELVIDATAAGVDILLGDFDEVFNFATIAADVLFGTNSAREIVQVGIASIDAALSDATVKNAFIAAWTAQGAVSRDGLRAWVDRAETDYRIGGIFPIQTFLSAWLNGSVILGYNNDLNRIAAGCASGKPTTLSNIGYEDEDWIVYNVPVPAGSQFNAIENVSQTWTLFPALAGVVAVSLGCKNSSRPAGNIRWTFDNGAFFVYNEPSVEFAPPAYLWYADGAVAESAAKALIALTTDYYEGIFWKPNGINDYDYNLDNGAIPPIEYVGSGGTYVLGYDRLDILVRKP